MDRNIILLPKDEWAFYSWENEIKDDNVEILYSILPNDANLFRRICFKIGYATKSNKIKLLKVFRLFVNHYIAEKMNAKNTPFNIIFYDLGAFAKYRSFAKYLKKVNPSIKTGYLFTNIVRKSAAKALKCEKDLLNYFDKVFAFDLNDAKEYGYDFSYLIYEPIVKHQPEITKDVFLVAKAKDRLGDILDIYDECKKQGLILDFYVNCIDDIALNKVGERNIHPNQVLPYNEVVKKLREAKCIVDIMQKSSTGVTLNVVEAIYFDKKIISNNLALQKEPFYNEKMIYILGERNDSLEEFINGECTPYSEEIKKLFDGEQLFNRLRNS